LQKKLKGKMQNSKNELKNNRCISQRYTPVRSGRI